MFNSTEPDPNAVVASNSIKFGIVSIEAPELRQCREPISLQGSSMISKWLQQKTEHYIFA